jgi:hypothetical protein
MGDPTPRGGTVPAGPAEAEDLEKKDPEGEAVVTDAVDTEVLNRQVAVLREEVAGLRRALESYSTIDMARGIVMASLSCSKEEAWLILVEVSQHTNVKLRDIARHIVASVAGEPVPRSVGAAMATALGRVRADRH